MRDRLLATAGRIVAARIVATRIVAARIVAAPRIAAVALTAAATIAAALLVPAAPAEAATADRWGFAYASGLTTPAWVDLDHTRQWGTWKAAFPGLWAQGMRLTTGRYLVKFPEVGLGARGNVHVTPVNRGGAYCEIVRWGQSGADEIVDVQCHKPGGPATDTPFTVLWTFSSGVLPSTATSYASLQYGTAAIVQSYNSTGGAVTVTPAPVGQYLVRFSGVGNVGPLSGDVQVTAVQPNASPRRCKPARWGNSGADIIVLVTCYDQAGLPVASEFTASYHKERSVIGSFAPPKYFGYIWTAGAGETNFNYPAGGFGANSFGSIPPVGRFLVKYPFLGLMETHAQVTAYGSGSYYCNLTQPWSHPAGTAEVDVICFDNAGTLTPQPFLSTFTSQV